MAKYTDSVKQQKGRHSCTVCGTVGCTSHSQASPPSHLQANARINTSAQAAQGGIVGAAKKFALRDEIERMNNCANTWGWRDMPAQDRNDKLITLQQLVDEFERIAASNMDGKELIREARATIRFWQSR